MGGKHLHSSKQRHTKQNWYARIGRKGGNATRVRHRGNYYGSIGKKGAAVTKRKMTGGK